MTSEQSIVNSALWAAYGDALGFITELTDESGLRARAKVGRVTDTIPWTRRVGGRFGVSINLPAGCYSDDTQLRLSTSRSIRTGAFDVETFSKVELPVWLVYELGGGRGTKAAATSLGTANRSWSTNVFATKTGRYVDGGGNGGAMRIQPHVWAARDWGVSESFLADVVKNVLCTHGHPCAFVGAGLHALCLAHCLATGNPPSPDIWMRALRALQSIVGILEQDSELRTVWLPMWEAQAGRRFGPALCEAIDDALHDARIADEQLGADGSGSAETYERTLRMLGGLDASLRGSATKTALMACLLVNLFANFPAEGLQTAANVLGSDTDSIATMAGAMFGVLNRQPPPGEVADREYITSEATRLAAIHAGERVSGFLYPDLLHWSPPAALLDYVGIDPSAQLAIAGLGGAQPIGKMTAQRDTGIVWQWLELKCGQKILAKRRERPITLDPTLLPNYRSPADGQQQRRPIEPVVRSATPPKVHREEAGQPSLFDTEAAGSRAPLRNASAVLIAAVKRLEKSKYDPKTLGETILELAARPDGREIIASLILKIVEARKRPSG